MYLFIFDLRINKINLKFKFPQMEEKKCLDCGEKLVGRIDKKFCNDSCRNSYNNKQAGRSSNLVRRINRILKVNLRVLEELNPNGKTTTTKDKMLQSGFNFNYYTNTYITREGRIYYFCYNMGYSELDNGRVVLVRNKEQ